MSTNQSQDKDQELSQSLIYHIANIIDGNQVTKSDIKDKGFETDDLDALLCIEWTFFSDYTDDRIAGGSYKGERCSSIYELDNITEKANNIAKYDKDLRVPFIKDLKKYEREGILKSEGTYQIKDFGKFSTKDVCNACNGSCNVRCNSCGGNGKQKCNSCYGSGSITQNRYNSNTKMHENYSTYCSNCGGSGSRSCSNCSGRGKVRCNDCRGHGYFIITRSIFAKTKPIYILKTNTSLANQDLEYYLNTKSIQFIYKTIYFELDNQKASSDNKEMFIYKGKSIVLKQDFSVKLKEYTCYAVSNPPHPFIKPNIFDDLFADELKFLKSNNEKKYISKKKALKSFDTYNKQPVLDKAIKNITSIRKESKEDTTEIVISACQGFISKNAASSLSSHINKFMDKVSPIYSPIIWIIGMIFLAIIGLTFVEYYFEQKGTRYIFEPIVSFIAITLVIAIVIYPVSLLITLFKRRKVPLEYRQKLRHREIFKLYSKVAILVFILSSGYGILSNKGHVPRSNGIPQKIVINNLKNGYNFLYKKSINIYKKTGFDKIINDLPSLQDLIKF